MFFILLPYIKQYIIFIHKFMKFQFLKGQDCIIKEKIFLNVKTAGREKKKKKLKTHHKEGNGKIKETYQAIFSQIYNDIIVIMD